MCRIDWEGFKNREFVVKCNNEKAYEEFLKEAYNNGVTWSTPEPLQYSKLKSCYSYFMNRLSYGSESYYMSVGIRIVEWRARTGVQRTFKEIINTIAEEGGIWEGKDSRIYYDDVNEGIVIEKKEGIYETHAFIINDDTLFTLKPQPVTFNEVLHSDYKCKVVCEEYLDEDDMEYMEFDELMEDLSTSFASGALKHIILEGQWYLEN